MQYPPPGYKPKSRSVPRAKRVFITANGLGPWPCIHCNELIYELGRGERKGNIHHKDEDPTNDVPENLEVLHAGCHVKHHLKGIPHTAEHSAKVGRKGRVFTPEWREKLSAASRGRTLSLEWREKISVGRKGHKVSEETRARMRAAQQRRREQKT
jgi:hypothetical protein